MIDVELKIDGIDEFMRELNKLEQRMKHDHLMKAATKAARIFRKEAVKSAPKDSGDLKKSIQLKKLKRRGDNEASVIVGPTTGKKAKYSGRHAHLLEFGTVKMRARPFMRPAFNKTKKDAEEAFKQELLRLLYG